MDADLRREARREAAETARRRSERVFSKPHRDAMPTIRVDGEGGSGHGASPARELAERTANLRLEDGANANANANADADANANVDASASASAAFADADSLSPADLLAMARRAAAEEAAAAAAESAAAREALANAAGPRGTSFARVARWGFASGLDAPKILGDVDSDAFGPRLGGEGGDRAAVVVGGGGMAQGLVDAVEYRVLHGIDPAEEVELVNVNAPKALPGAPPTERDAAAWRGGAILAAIEPSREHWLKRDEWNEGGCVPGRGARKLGSAEPLLAQMLHYCNALQ